MTLPISWMPGAKIAISRVAACAGAPVLVRQHLEQLVVPRLAAERLHRADPAERLDEVHDDQRHRVPGPPVGDRAVAPEPGREPEQQREARQRDQRHPPVQEQQDDRDRHQVQRGDHQVVQATVDQLTDRVHIGGQPGDHPAGGVLLVEREREPLEVVVHPAAQVEQDRLADPAGRDQEAPLARVRDRAGDHEADRDRDQHAVVAVLDHRRDAPVDAELHQVRAGQPGRALDQQQQHGPADQPAVRAEQDAEQPPAAVPQPDRGLGGQLVGALGGDAAPVLGRDGHRTVTSSAVADSTAR